MKIQSRMVETLQISGLESLDPINVSFEDFGKGQGAVIVKCYGQSWCSFWGAMGDRTIREFFSSCDNDYLIKNLSSGLRSNIVDQDNLKSHAKAYVNQLANENDINEDDANELINEIDLNLNQIEHNYELLCRIYGDDWHYSLPTKPNPDYVYLDRIIKAVKEAIKMENK